MRSYRTQCYNKTPTYMVVVPYLIDQMTISVRVQTIIVLTFCINECNTHSDRCRMFMKGFHWFVVAVVAKYILGISKCRILQFREFEWIISCACNSFVILCYIMRICTMEDDWLKLHITRPIIWGFLSVPSNYYSEIGSSAVVWIE